MVALSEPNCSKIDIVLSSADFLNVSVSFLADRTNGRAYATVLRLSSSVCLQRYVLWLNDAS